MGASTGGPVGFKEARAERRKESVADAAPPVRFRMPATVMGIGKAAPTGGGGGGGGGGGAFGPYVVAAVGTLTVAPADVLAFRRSANYRVYEQYDHTTHEKGPDLLDS